MQCLRLAAALSVLALALAVEEPTKQDAAAAKATQPVEDSTGVRRGQTCLTGQYGIGLERPSEYKKHIAASPEAQETVALAREGIRQILRGNSNHLLVVVGPCSLHDEASTKEYATRLSALAKKLDKELVIVMRTYFEKPRTVVGWKGLINDPKRDFSRQIDAGLPLARKILKDIVEMGLPCATEFLCPITAHYIADLVSYGCIGARTVESQIHRELASYLPMPIGFKNSRSGDVDVAIDACVSASSPHVFLTLAHDGGVMATESKGNTDPHVVLRGGASGPNYSKVGVDAAVKLLEARGATSPAVVVDCSHDNSGKSFKQQLVVAADVIKQISEGSLYIRGVMLESFLEEGKHNLETSEHKFGQSYTDECIGWEATEKILESLAEAVRMRNNTVRQMLKARELESLAQQRQAMEDMKMRAQIRAEQINKRLA